MTQMTSLVYGVVLMGLFWAPSAMASDAAVPRTVIESFTSAPESRWEFVADTVMGGVSSGALTFTEVGDQPVLRLTGTVSTENRGGFIQARMPMVTALPADAQGLWLKVRGNKQRYFVHLRTSGTVLPWQYYQAGFDVTEDWKIVRLSWADFKPSGDFLRDTPLPQNIRSIGVVAFGRDHQAEIEVAQIGYD
jgi:hypothetical protein